MVLGIINLSTLFCGFAFLDGDRVMEEMRQGNGRHGNRVPRDMVTGDSRHGNRVIKDIIT